MQTIAVIDYGMGNLHSAAKALELVADGARVVVTNDAARIRGADRVVFPGVGAIRDCMQEIRRLGLDEVVRETVRTKPFLAICVGLQALMDCSDENEGTPCLGVFSGRVRHFGAGLTDIRGDRLKVPHMGWNQVRQSRAHPLWHGIAQDSRFYFVHSYYVDAAQPDLVAGTAMYGVNFAAALARGNAFAVQFHPEKSQKSGLKLLANFVRWDGEV